MNPVDTLPASANVYEARAAEGLEHLGLTVAVDHLDGAAQRAAAESWSYSHFLGYLLDGELRQRHEKTVAMSLRFAKFPVHKTLDGFDFAAQPSIDRRLIDELATGRFLHEGRNVVLLGPPGVGKTHLAIALGVRTCELGHRAGFTHRDRPRAPADPRRRRREARPRDEEPHATEAPGDR